MDIQLALLCRQSCAIATGRRESLSTAGPATWFRPLLAVLLIAVMIGSVDLAAGGSGARVAMTADHFAGKGN